MKPRKFILIMFFTIICLLSILCYYGFLIPIGEKNVHGFPLEYYEFDAVNAFEDIQAGKLPTIFEIEEEQYDMKQIPSKKNNMVWKEAELLGIQRGILKNMNITRRMDLNLLYYVIPCENIERGAQFASYYSSSFSLEKDGFHRLNLIISIDPRRQSVLVDRREYYPVYNYNEKVIKIDELNLSYIDVVKIAEDNGGNEIREQVNSKCNIDVLLAPGSRNENWQVMYEKTRILLELNIDDKTGNIVPDKKN